MVNFNKNSKEILDKGSKMITKKVPNKIKNDQYLKYLSSLDFFGFGFFAITKITNTGVKTPTI